jgi:hypothetical protein
MKPLEPSSMDIEKILAELKADREQIEEAIMSLELLARGRRRKREGPPAWMTEIAVPNHRGTPTDPPLPPGAAMPVPRPAADLVWAVSGRKRPAS